MTDSDERLDPADGREWLKNQLGDIDQLAQVVGQVGEVLVRAAGVAAAAGRVHFGVDHFVEAVTGEDPDGKKLAPLTRGLRGAEGLLDLVTALPLPLASAFPASKWALRLTKVLRQSSRIRLLKTAVDVGKMLEDGFGEITATQPTTPTTPEVTAAIDPKPLLAVVPAQSPEPTDTVDDESGDS